MVKAGNKRANKVAKTSSSSNTQSSVCSECSPPLKRNGAKAVRDVILSSQEQNAFNKHRTEIKQISALVILKCGLGVAEKKTI
jgi:hypothetical protein